MAKRKKVEPVPTIMLVGCDVRLTRDQCETLKQCFDMRMDALEEERIFHEVYDGENRFLGYDNTDDFISLTNEIDKMKSLLSALNKGALYDLVEVG